MTKYLVSLDVVSRRLRLGVISAALGRQPSPESPEVRQPVASPFNTMQRRFSSTCWRLASSAKPNATLESHVTSLLRRLPKDFRQRLKRLGTDIRPIVSIGVFSTRNITTLAIKKQTFRKLGALDCNFQVSYYDIRDR